MNLKTILLSTLLFTGMVLGQTWSTRYPANVRYIAGGYSDSRPYFSTLNAALNDVKPYATSDNPYVFWLMSDTLQIADWDSVYNDGLSMSDSIYTHYVSAGKIKWAGFDIDTSKGGRGGSSVLNLESMAATTPYFNIARWDSSGLALSAWQEQLTTALLKIDSLFNSRTLFSNISPTYFSISGDSLLFTMPTHIFDPDTFYTNDFDSTTYVRTTGDQYITGNKHYAGTLDFEPVLGPSGVLILPSGYSNEPRAIFSDGSWIYSRQSGVTYALAMLDSTSKALKLANSIEYSAFTQATIDSILYLIKQPHVNLHDATYTPAIAVASTYVKFAPGFTTGEAYRTTVAGDTITVASGADGDYMLYFTMTVNSAATDDYTLQIRKNNTAVHSLRFTGAGAAEYITVSTFYYFDDLVAGDDISLYITNTVDADDPVCTNIALRFKREHQ